MLIHVQQTPTKHKAAIEILTKVITITQNQSITDSGMWTKFWCIQITFTG